MRIAIGGFQHETNTFAPSRATFEDFARGSAWPPMLTGGEMFDAVAGINLPIAGFVDEMKGTSHELIPTVWAAASPSAHVTRDAFERICGSLVEHIHAAEPDAVYLDLHGAMVAEHVDDGEAEILRRVRDVLRPGVPIVASLDLHANVTPAMLERAEILVAYRTYPHVDMAETGARVGFLLREVADGMHLPYRASRRISYIIPLTAQCTDLEPARSIYATLGGMESADVPSLSFTPGFPAADFPGCGPVVWCYGRTQEYADHAANTLAGTIEAHEAHWDALALAPREAVQAAMQIARNAKRPVVIADTQDNPGAGGNSDTTGMLRALVENRAERAALGIMVDPEAAEKAHLAGVGGEIEIALGGRSGIPGDAPFHGRFLVEALADGHVVGKGGFYRGARMNLGPSACLRIGGVRVVVASAKAQLADQELYRFVGIEPTQQAILVNKSSVHFRADFTAIAEKILVAKSPGPMVADPGELPWKNLAPGIKLRPGGAAFHP